MSEKMKAKRYWGKNGMSLPTTILVSILMIMLTVTFLYPLYFMLINSLKSSTEYYMSQFALPQALNWNNYKIMLVDFNILQYFKNSLIVSITSCVLITLLSVFASYAFAHLRFRGRAIAYMAIVATMFLPGQATMIPQYVLFSRLRLINNYWSVILSYMASGLPSSILLLRAAFVGIPGELLESGKIDGAGYFSTVFHIALPVTVAGVSIQVIFNFIGYWGDLLTPMLLLSGGAKRTIMVALSSLISENGSEPTRQLTGILLSVVPTLVLYLCLQKYMMKGMLVGSLKG